MHFICKCLWRIPWNTVWDNTLQNINYYLSIRTLKLRNSAKHNLHLLVHLTFIIALWGRFYSQLHLRVRKSKYLCYWITPTRRCNYLPWKVFLPLNVDDENGADTTVQTGGSFSKFWWCVLHEHRWMGLDQWALSRISIHSSYSNLLNGISGGYAKAWRGGRKMDE